MLLYGDLALHHRVLPRRPARHRSACSRPRSSSRSSSCRSPSSCWSGCRGARPSRAGATAPRNGARRAPKRRCRCHASSSIVDAEHDGARLDRFLAARPAGPLALADPAADQGRPRHGRGRHALRAEPAGAAPARSYRRRHARRRSPPTPRAGGAAARASSTRTPTSSSSTSRPGWSCIPAAGHAAGTLVNALLHHVDDLSGIGGELRPGIVHRLDRGTSGLDGRRQERRGAPGAGAAVPRPRGREGIRRAGLGRRAGRAGASTRRSAAIPSDRQKMSTRARRAREAVTRITWARHLHGRDAAAGRDRTPAARTRSACT